MYVWSLQAVFCRVNSTRHLFMTDSSSGDPKETSSHQTTVKPRAVSSLIFKRSWSLRLYNYPTFGTKTITCGLNSCLFPKQLWRCVKSKQKQTKIICTQTVFTDEFTKRSWVHVVTSFTQSCEPPTIFPCDVLSLLMLLSYSVMILSPVANKTAWLWNVSNWCFFGASNDFFQSFVSPVVTNLNHVAAPNLEKACVYK